MDLFHRVAFDLTSILLFNEELLSQTRAWMDKYEWVIESVVAGDPVEVPRSAFQDTEKLMLAIGKHANENVQSALKKVRKDLNNLKLMAELFNIRIQEEGGEPNSPVQLFIH